MKLICALFFIFTVHYAAYCVPVPHKFSEKAMHKERQFNFVRQYIGGMMMMMFGSPGQAYAHTHDLIEYRRARGTHYGDFLDEYMPCKECHKCGKCEADKTVCLEITCFECSPFDRHCRMKCVRICDRWYISCTRSICEEIAQNRDAVVYGIKPTTTPKPIIYATPDASGGVYSGAL